MKTKILLITILALMMALPVDAAPPQGRGKDFTWGGQSLAIDNGTFINANNIMMFVTNHGNFGRDLTDRFGQDAGTFYPYTSIEAVADGSQNSYVLYASGLWIGGKVGSDTRIVIAEYSDEYVPGPMSDSTFSPDRPEYKVYKLYKDSLANNPNSDYLNWPVDQGAPVNEDGTPAMIGDQMCWAVYNDADPAQHTNDAGNTDPLGLEVRQTTFAFDRTDPLGNVIFLKFQIFNRGPNTITDCYLSLWADPDLGGYTDDLVGCDVEKSLGFVYNANNNDQLYGSNPPCLGYDFFQGPMIHTGDDADTARMWDTTWVGYKNLGMVSFNKYINGTDPNNYTETYNYMQGLRPNGNPYTYDGEATLYMHAGDPVAGTGDLDFDPADRRWMQSTGPISFAPGDSTEILAAIIVGRGADRLSSISVMKYYDQFAQSAYDINFELAEPPAAPVVTATNLDGAIVLTWTDTSEVDPGDYDFEGYTVYQGSRDGSGDMVWRRIATYDIDNGVGTILDDVLDVETGVLEYRGVKFGSDAGVRRYFATDQDHIRGGPLRNLRTYYFKVEAYSHDPEATPKTLTSAASVEVRPQGPIAGTVYHGVTGDTLDVTHTAGGSNGSVVPLVLDPSALNGHTYRVEFEDTLGIVVDTTYDPEHPNDLEHADFDSTNIAWHIYDVTAGEYVVQYETNQSGDDDYPIVDGVMVKVLGPSFGVVEINEVEGASGAIEPPDNVMYSLNSTADWYVSSDAGSDFSRLNWRGKIGTYDWEFRFTEQGSEYYDWNTDEKWPNRAPFEIWNIGIGTPDDPSDDVRIQFFILDDDESGGWSYGDRIYPFESEYPDEPLPALAEYTWDDDFRIGRIIFNDYSHETTEPATGTVVRFVTAKVNTSSDVFTFSTQSPTLTKSDNALANIKAVPNPFYLYGPYDPTIGNHRIEFHNLPAECTIRIYNLAGEFIDEIRKNDASTSIASWDVKTAHGLPPASGVYVYVVNAPGYGQKIGKIAVFTEVEVLRQY